MSSAGDTWVYGRSLMASGLRTEAVTDGLLLKTPKLCNKKIVLPEITGLSYAVPGRSGNGEWRLSRSGRRGPDSDMLQRGWSG